MTRSVLTLALCALLPLSGCFAVRYSTGEVEPATRRDLEVHKTWSHSLVWGLASANEIDVAALCGPQGALDLRSHYGPFGLFGQVVSLGFWTPLRVKVTCNPPLPTWTGPVAGAPLAVPVEAPVARYPEERGILVIPEAGRTVIVVEQ